MYLRLILIGGLAIWFVPNVWVKGAFALLFLYLSGFQMMTLWNHHRTIIWLDLYPVQQQWKQKAVLQWLRTIMLFQTVVFGLLLALQFQWTGMIGIWVLGTLFSYAFVQTYVKQRLN